MNRIALRAVVLLGGCAALPAVGQPTTTGPFRVARGQLTFDAEGIEQPGHPGHSRRLHWPGGASGPTIGRGYDLKLRTAAEVEADLVAAGVPGETAKAYAKGAGMGTADPREAEDFVEANRDRLTELTPAQQKALFERTYPRYEARAKAVCARDDLVKQYGKVDWDGLEPAIRDVLTDLAYRGDYGMKSVRAPRLIQRAVVENDRAEFTRLMADRDGWPNVPCDRFYRRVHFLRQAGTPAPAAGGARIVFDDNAPKARPYSSPQTEKVGTTAAKTAGEPAFRPRDGRPQAAEYARELGRRLRDGGVPELDGTAAEQYARLKTSPLVETLWLSERLPAADRKRLDEARDLLRQARAARDELPAVRRKGDRKAEAALTAKLAALRKEVAAKTYCLRLSLEEAQFRADRGDMVIAAWAAGEKAGIAWVVPTRGADGRLKDSDDWPGVPVPHAAFAGRTATGYAPLGDAFPSAEALDGLGLFVLRSTPKPTQPDPD